MVLVSIRVVVVMFSLLIVPFGMSTVRDEMCIVVVRMGALRPMAAEPDEETQKRQDGRPQNGSGSQRPRCLAVLPHAGSGQHDRRERRQRQQYGHRQQFWNQCNVH